MTAIRAEAPGDAAAIRRVLEAAFGRPEEAVVGHALFTPVTIDGAAVVGMGLGPLAVAPAHQRRGIGARLVRHGLERLRATPCSFVVVLGHPS